jgi:hypothetical protein
MNTKDRRPEPRAAAAPTDAAKPPHEQEAPAAEPALLERLHELRDVLRAASAFDLHMQVSQSHVAVGGALGDAIYWLFRELLSHVSRRPEARALILTSDRLADGAVCIQLRERHAEPPAGSTLGPIDVERIGRRIRELGGHVDAEESDGLIVKVVLPR